MSTKNKYILSQRAIKARYTNTRSLHDHIQKIEPNNYASIIAKATTNTKCIKYIHKHSTNLCQSKTDSVPPPIEPTNEPQDVDNEPAKTNQVNKIMSSMQRLSQPNKSIAATLKDFHEIYGVVFDDAQVKIIDGGYDDIYQLRSLLQKLEIQKGFLFGIGEPKEAISKVHKLLEFFEKYLDCRKEDKWDNIPLKDAMKMIKYSFNTILTYPVQGKQYHTKNVYKKFQNIRNKIPAFSTAEISAMEIRDNAIESLEESDAVVVHEEQKMEKKAKDDENKDKHNKDIKGDKDSDRDKDIAAEDDENKDEHSKDIEGDKDSDREKDSAAEDDEKEEDSVDENGDAQKGKDKGKGKGKKGTGKSKKGKNKGMVKGKNKGRVKGKNKGKEKRKGKGKGKNHGGSRRGWNAMVEVRKPSGVLKIYQAKMGDEKGFQKFKHWITHNGVEVDDWARATGGDEEEDLCESLGLCND